MLSHLYVLTDDQHYPHSSWVERIEQALIGGAALIQLREKKLTDQQQVHNVLYRNTTVLRDFVWPRLAAVYHGSGCTLSSALTCFLALGDDIETACQRAQDYTYASLKHAQALGRGQLIPQRNKLQHTC